MNAKEKLPLEYSSDWIELGIVSRESIADQEREYATGDDRCTEHYRWRSFCSFFERQQALSPKLAQQLFTLGANDPDLSMGGSIMVRVLRHPDCPEYLLRSCLDSEEKFLKRIAEERLSKSGCIRKGVPE